MIGIDRDKVRFIILKARQLNAKDQPGLEDPAGSNMSDDNFLEVLSGDADDASEEEITSIIEDMNVDERARLVALAWVGRGDYEAPDEWEDAVRAAREERTTPTARYLLGMPLLGDYLEEGLAAFGFALAGEENADELPEGAPGLRREDPGENMPIRHRGPGSAGESTTD